MEFRLCCVVLFCLLVDCCDYCLMSCVLILLCVLCVYIHVFFNYYWSYIVVIDRVCCILNLSYYLCCQ